MTLPYLKPTTWQKEFFPIWTGQALSLAGSRIVQFALVWYLTEETGSAIVLMVATLVGIVPEIVISPIAGVYVDRWDRQIVLILADGVVALVSWWLAFLFLQGSISVIHIYLAMVVRAIGGSFHSLAFQSSTSLMVPEKQLTRVNGLNQLLTGGLNIAAPPIGALLMTLLPLFGVMMVDVISALFALIPLTLFLIPLPPKQSDRGDLDSLWSDLYLAVQYIVSWRGLLFISISFMLIQLILTPAFALLPLLVSEYFGGTAIDLGALEAVLGIGMVIGGLALSIWGGFKRRIFSALAGLILLGVSLIGMGLAAANAFFIVIASVFVIGVAVPFVNGPIMAIYQAKVDPSIQGRVFSMMSSLILLATPVGLLLAGPLSDWFNPQIWYWIAGILCISLSIVMFFVPAVVNIETYQPKMQEN